MKKILIATAVGLLAAGQVAAQESPWLVRARAVNVASINENTTAVTGLAVKDKTIPEVDVTYFFNKNVAAELILTVPQQMTVSNTASGNIGTFKALPPTLTLQYHFTDFNGYKPYVGAGLNYTKITHTNVASGAYSLDDHTYGLALQAGVDVPLTKQVSLNFDLKKVQIKTDVYSGSTGAKAGSLKLDPTLIGVGVGYRF
jgi:outer membrane protein